MSKLEKVIHQLTEDDSIAIAESLKSSKADKFLSLFEMIREDGQAYDGIQNELEINTSAFYTLKSRLYDKIQEYLIDNMEEPRIDVLKKVASIPSLIYDTPRETAVAILQKLETDLKEFDMPYELTEVYAAFKKVYLHTDKYYEYSQQYNRNVAYTVALDKAEDLAADFNRQLGDYFASRNKDMMEVLTLIKQKMENLMQLYESHRLYIYQSIVNVSFELFLPESEHTNDDEPVEDVLRKCEEIISKNSKDLNYQYLGNVINFLFFEYYHKLGQHKKASEYFVAVNDHMPNFMLYSFCAFASKFLISKMQRYISEGRETELYEENKAISKEFHRDAGDVPNYINVSKYIAASSYYAGENKKAIDELNDLLNQISFKHYGHSEVEIKLFLALCYSMDNKYDLAWNVVRSASRKTKELNEVWNYENAATIVKLMKLQMGTNPKGMEKKIERLCDQFRLLNQGESKMLEFLKMDEAFISSLAQSVK